ncbi:hypothetical protein [Pseudonocardia endophytica]|uniref:hypothetical protein n=1 Tax=Pseudonocardia endophytica TaxID=401976 RepID=UPI0014054B9B|nr:hypothetical protein [Pseudonocardia endophytica]
MTDLAEMATSGPFVSAVVTEPFPPDDQFVLGAGGPGQTLGGEDVVQDCGIVLVHT